MKPFHHCVLSLYVSSATCLKRLYRLKFCLKFRRAASVARTPKGETHGPSQGKSVIITGAGSGIGRAASLLFTKEGAKLIAVDRTEA